jgi:hypothetical protein
MPFSFARAIFDGNLLFSAGKQHLAVDSQESLP